MDPRSLWVEMGVLEIITFLEKADLEPRYVSWIIANQKEAQAGDVRAHCRLLHIIGWIDRHLEFFMRKKNGKIPNNISDPNYDINEIVDIDNLKASLKRVIDVDSMFLDPRSIGDSNVIDEIEEGWEESSYDALESSESDNVMAPFIFDRRLFKNFRLSAEYLQSGSLTHCKLREIKTSNIDKSSSERSTSVSETNSTHSTAYRRTIVRDLAKNGKLQSFSKKIKSTKGNRFYVSMVEAITLLENSNVDPFQLQIKDIYLNKARSSWQARWKCQNGHRRRKSFTYRTNAFNTRYPSNEIVDSSKLVSLALKDAIKFLSSVAENNVSDFEICPRCTTHNVLDSFKT